MGRKPRCPKEGLNRGAWSLKEDEVLSNYIQLHGEGKWTTLPQKAGLNRCGKSCRLRWMNYLRPGIKRGDISPEEEDLIIRLHRLLGNRWSLIAGRLPGRTDNEIKNYWNSVLAKKLNAEAPKTLKNREDKKSSGNSSDITITPNGEDKVLHSFDEGLHLKKKNRCPPSSTSADINDGCTWESPKDNNVVNMDNLDFSQSGIEDVFENSNMRENHHKLQPMFEKEFDNLTSLLELEDEKWTDLL